MAATKRRPSLQTLLVHSNIMLRIRGGLNEDIMIGNNSNSSSSCKSQRMGDDKDVYRFKKLSGIDFVYMVSFYLIKTTDIKEHFDTYPSI